MPGPVREALRASVIREYLRGKNKIEIAAELGIHESNVRGTLNLPEVRAEIDRANEESYRQILDRRVVLAAECLEGLLSLARDEETPASVRRQAWSDLASRLGLTAETAVRLEGAGPVAAVQVNLQGLAPEQLRALAWGDDPQVVDIEPDE